MEDKERPVQEGLLSPWWTLNTALTACSSEIACCHLSSSGKKQDLFSLYPRGQLVQGCTGQALGECRGQGVVGEWKED